MKNRYRIYRRKGGQYYALDRETGRRFSLQTDVRTEALRLLQAKNDAHHQPAFNLQLARMYLAAADPAASSRTWQEVFAAIDSIAVKKHWLHTGSWWRPAAQK